MAQTVALQRGTTTVVADGSTFATLFTQSGGTATRVILNSVSFWTSGTYDTQIRAILAVKSAGSSTNVFTVGLKVFTNSLGISAFDFSPMMKTTAFATVGGTTSNNIIGATLMYADQASSPGGTFASRPSGSGVICNSATENGFGQSGGCYDKVATNFWIGPSDVVCVKIFSNGGGAKTWNVGYSFATVTES